MIPDTFLRPGLRACVVLVLCFPVVSLAQEVLEEIIVRADFRERAVAELPASISVLDEQLVNEAAVQHFEELIQLVPNLNWSGDGHRARYLQIRGVGELEQYEGAPNPSVGFLIDDIDFSGIGTIATLFDIQQVEILRGPQGSRYGANALGGLIYMQSVAPTEEFSGRVKIDAGSDGVFSAGIAFGGPLIAGRSLRYRLSAHHFQGNGFRDNSFLRRDDTNGREETTLRGRLRWQASDNWTVNFTTMFSDVDDGYDAFAIDNSLTMLSDKPGKDAQQSFGTAVKATWTGAESFSLTSITTFAHSDIDFSFDADWGNADSWLPFTYDFTVDNDRERKTISQEFRLASSDAGRIFNDSADWLLGIYVMQLEDELRTVTEGILIDPDPVFGYTFTVDDEFSGKYAAVNAAVFGRLDFDIGQTSQLGIGLRVERRTTDYSNATGLSFDPGETMIGGELTFTHEISEGTRGFVILARGFKAGGFNPGFGVPEDRRQFDTEYVWNLEGGVKARWLDDKLHVNASVFLSERQDQQIRTSFQLVANDPASFVFFTDNSDEGRTTGIEMDVRWLPSDAWQLYANVGLLNAEIRSFGTAEVSLDGREQAHAPAYTLAVGGAYRHPGGWNGRLDVSARDDFFFDYSHDQKSTAYELVNLRLGYDAEQWSAHLWIRNLFDEKYAVRGFYFGNEPPLFEKKLYIRQGDPRLIGLTLELRF
ncbi:MAG: TonB-dependent receptor [Gammaproteobacteria bacterium]|nr:MAG: TonB-dependent receptor [Gammaproteobacteria bacterium]